MIYYNKKTNTIPREYASEAIERDGCRFRCAIETNKKIKRILEEHSKSSGLDNFTMLLADACDDNRKWVFYDGKRKHIMQNWVNKMGGLSLAIIIASCNPKDQEIESKKSIVIHFRNKIKPYKILSDSYRIRAYIPNRGYLEGRL